MQVINLLPHSPYIRENTALCDEWDKLQRPELPLTVFISRHQVLAQPNALAASEFVPDTVQDRDLLKRFKQTPGVMVDFGLFRDRVRRGWDFEKAAKTPSRIKTRTHTSGREKSPTGWMSIYQYAKETPKVSFSTFRARVAKLGWSVERALNTPAR